MFCCLFVFVLFCLVVFFFGGGAGGKGICLGFGFCPVSSLLAVFFHLFGFVWLCFVVCVSVCLLLVCLFVLAC